MKRHERNWQTVERLIVAPGQKSACDEDVSVKPSQENEQNSTRYSLCLRVEADRETCELVEVAPRVAFVGQLLARLYAWLFIRVRGDDRLVGRPFFCRENSEKLRCDCKVFDYVAIAKFSGVVRKHDEILSKTKQTSGYCVEH